MPAMKIRGLPWWMIGLLMLGSIINYLTRSTLAVAAPTLTKDPDIIEQEKVRVDQLVSIALACQVSAWRQRDTIKQRAKRGSWGNCGCVMANVRDVPPLRAMSGDVRA